MIKTKRQTGELNEEELERGKELGRREGEREKGRTGPRARGSGVPGGGRSLSWARAFSSSKNLVNRELALLLCTVFESLMVHLLFLGRFPFSDSGPWDVDSLGLRVV